MAACVWLIARTPGSGRPHAGLRDRPARSLGARGIKDYFGADRPYTRDSAGIYDQFLKDWGGDISDHLKYHLKDRTSAPELTGPSGQWQGRGGAFKVFQDFDEDRMCEDVMACVRNDQRDRTGAPRSKSPARRIRDVVQLCRSTQDGFLGRRRDSIAACKSD